MTSPRVSVLMTIYNAAPFLRQSIDSLIAQTFTDWELIVVENGSTDGSSAVLSKYTDPRIRNFFLPSNIGRTPALRYAFERVRGEYIAVLDADDLAMPGRFMRQVDFLDHNKDVVLVGTWAEQIDPAGRVFDVWQPPVDPVLLHDSLGWLDPIVHSSVMFRRQEAISVGGYPEEYVFSQDFALILKLVERGKLAIIDEFLCKLRISSGRMSSSPEYQMAVAQEGLLLLKYAFEKLPLSDKARRMNRCAVSKYEIRCGVALIRRGQFVSGIIKIIRAFIKEPRILWINNLFRSRFYAA